MPGVVEAESHSEWPSRGLSSGTPDPGRLACLGIRGEGGAQHASEHTKPHPDDVPRFLLAPFLGPCIPELSSCSSLRRVPTICSSLLRAFQCIPCIRSTAFECEIPSCLSAVSWNMPPVFPKISKCSCISAYPEFLRCSKRLLCCPYFSLNFSAYASSVQ